MKKRGPFHHRLWRRIVLVLCHLAATMATRTVVRLSTRLISHKILVRIKRESRKNPGRWRCGYVGNCAFKLLATWESRNTIWSLGSGLQTLICLHNKGRHNIGEKKGLCHGQGQVNVSYWDSCHSQKWLDSAVPPSTRRIGLCPFLKAALKSFPNASYLKAADDWMCCLAAMSLEEHKWLDRVIDRRTGVNKNDCWVSPVVRPYLIVRKNRVACFGHTSVYALKNLASG